VQRKSKAQERIIAEEFQVTWRELVRKVEELIHKGDVQRTVIKQSGRVFLDIPLAVALVEAVPATSLTAVGAIAAVATNCTISAVRIESRMCSKHVSHIGSRPAVVLSGLKNELSGCIRPFTCFSSELSVATLIRSAISQGIMSEIRRLTIADYNRIVSIWKEAGLPYRPEGRDSREEMARQMQRFPDRFIGAFEGSELAGLCIGTDDGRKGWINRLAVHPKHRRVGIGTLLLREMERILKKRGLNVISALIEDRNISSLAFLERCGYKIHRIIVYVSKRESERV